LIDEIDSAEKRRLVWKSKTMRYKVKQERDKVLVSAIADEWTIFPRHFVQYVSPTHLGQGY
jgi:hypothetical protein